MGKQKKKPKSHARCEGFQLEDSGFEKGNDEREPVATDSKHWIPTCEGSDPEKRKNRGSVLGDSVSGLSTPDPSSQDKVLTPATKSKPWSLQGSPNPFLSGKGFPILSDLQAKGVSPGILPLIWLRILDFEHPKNWGFRADVLKAATKGHTELDLLLKRTADKLGFDLEDLEQQRLEEASSNGSQTKLDLGATFTEVFANSPSTFLSEAGRRALLYPSPKKAQPDAVDFALNFDVLIDAVVGNAKASNKLSTAANDSDEVVGEVPDAASKMAPLDSTLVPMATPDRANTTCTDVVLPTTTTVAATG